MMKKIIATTFAVSAIALMSGCGSDGNSADDPGGQGASISIRTVMGGEHVFSGSHNTACYGSPDGRIDSVTVTATTWHTGATIFTGDATCSSTPSASGRIAGYITKGAEKQISGWRGQGDVAPQRADKTGSLSENETVTTINIKITEIDDPSGLFGGVNIGFETSAFYVFDDTAGNGTYVMYGDDDGSFASASDPYISVDNGTSPISSTPKYMPIAAVSGNDFEIGLGYTSWANDCYINGTIGDSRDIVDFGGPTGDPVDSVYTSINVTFTQEMYGSSDGSCDPATKNALNNDVIYLGEAVLDGTTDSITGWVDGSGSAVSAPMKQDGTGALTDSESYTNMTYTVSNSSIPSLLPAGTVFPLTYVLDDTGATPVIYAVSAGVADIDSKQVCAGCP